MVQSVAAVPEKTNLFIPNTFSPDGDQQNDFFNAFTNEAGIKILKMEIFNRQGRLVFAGENMEVSNPASGWDGSYNGELLPAGVYVYLITLQLPDGSRARKAGDVLLL